MLQHRGLIGRTVPMLTAYCDDSEERSFVVVGGWIASTKESQKRLELVKLRVLESLIDPGARNEVKLSASD